MGAYVTGSRYFPALVSRCRVCPSGGRQPLQLIGVMRDGPTCCRMGAKMMREICAGLSMSSYINNHLAKGRGTGAIIHPTPDQKGKLQVRYGDRGRGLFAMSIIHKGSVMRDVAGSSSNNFHNL